MGILIGVLIVVVIAAIALALVVKNLLRIAGPNEVLVFSGMKHPAPDGTRVGYKVLKGGRRVRVPLLEVVDSMDLTNMIVPVTIHNAFSKGGIPLTVESVANVKIAGEMPLLGNAIERLLGKSRAEIMRIAQETLEGNLRGVLAAMTPEQVNEDREKFEQGLIEEADHDLRRLGLVLDTLKIQNISDERGYLNSIGRKKNAEVQKSAKVAEATNKAVATVRTAQNWETTEVARIDAAIRTLTAQTERKVAEASSRKDALIAEQQGQVVALLAQAQAEFEVQKNRIEQERRRLRADILEPAEAKRSEAVARAKGHAARIVEEGRAKAVALDQVIASWNLAGQSARDIFLFQKLEQLTGLITSTIKDIKVDRVTVLPGGAGTGSLATQLVSGNEQIKAALGVDLAQALKAKLAPPTPPAHDVKL